MLHSSHVLMIQTEKKKKKKLKLKLLLSCCTLWSFLYLVFSEILDCVMTKQCSFNWV